ncbi:MAG: glycosyltransferase [Nitrospirota bacterium]
MPKVSVIIPTYNRADFLYSAISSVLAQTFQDFEIIVVDDASTDATRDITEGFKEKRLIYVNHKKNKGEAFSRNSGVMQAKGIYIAFLDDDDEWSPEKLSKQVDLLDNAADNVGLVYTGYSVIEKNSQNVLSIKLPSNKGVVYEDIIRRNFIGTPSTVLIRRACIEKVGLFDEDIAYGLDHDMWIRIAQFFHFDYIGESLVRYNVHLNRITNNTPLRAKGIEDLTKKYGNDFILNNTFYRNSLLPLGVQLCILGDMKNGIKLLKKAVRADPFILRNYFFLGSALCGEANFSRIRRMKHYLSALIRDNSS